MKIIGSIVATVVALVLEQLWEDLFFSKLWVWFMVPIFDLNPFKNSGSHWVNFYCKGYMTKNPVETNKKLEGPFFRRIT